MLRAAFEAQPPHLSGDALEGLGGEERSHALSLFAAWTAVAGRSVRLSELSLQCADALELHSTLEECGAQLEEWEMTRCPCGEEVLRALLHGLQQQPLRHLNLGYDALGLTGVRCLRSFATWRSLRQLGLEMNGIGDAGCHEVAGLLDALPELRGLELGWNELSPTSAPALAGLARRGLARLGLGGNKLGSEGAQELLLAAMDHAGRLELDLSMNHVAAPPLRALTEWLESGDRVLPRVTVSLEWNVVDDVGIVRRLASALSVHPEAEPLIRLANNDELAELDPAQLSSSSNGLLCC